MKLKTCILLSMIGAAVGLGNNQGRIHDLPKLQYYIDEGYTLCLECGAKLVSEKEFEDSNNKKYLKRIAELESEIEHLKYDILKKDEYIELLKKDLQRDYEKFKNMKQDIKSLNEKLEKISKDNEEINYKLLKYEQGLIRFFD